MSAPEGIEYGARDGIGRIRLNRPEVRNALGPPQLRALERAVTQASGDAAVRVLVVAGAGSAFCAGGDLKSMPERLGQPPAARRIGLLETCEALFRLRRLPKPVIAAINGPAAGLGLGLALACDIRIAAEGATLACSFVRVGLHPDFGTTHLLTRLVGTGRACELIFTGDALDAAAALRLGLVNQVVAAGEAEAAALELAARLAQGPPVALGMAKRAIYQAAEARLEDIVELEAAFQAICSATEDAREGVRAFAERRPPRFEGR